MFRAGLMAAALALLAFPGTVHSQGSVFPIQSLRFGTLIPGLVTTVSAQDGDGRAAIEVRGRGQVTVSFRLPHALSTSSGGNLPLIFGPTDGRAVIAGNGRVHLFDPRSQFGFVLSGSDGQATIYLGGAATPAVTQRPGRYEGEITVTVTISNGTT
jgi:hypothetical protein